jgi:cytochrome c-type biogenesis protein
MGFDITLAGAFVAGLLSFLSPCVLPLVPPYLCFLAGVSFDEFTSESESITASVFRTALAFVLGFTTVFVMLGATASFVGQALTRHLDTLSMFAGAIIVLMGLHFLGVLRWSWLLATKRVDVQRKPPGMLGGYIVGLAFAFGWTPCVGPVLAAILFLAASNETAWQGASLLLVYSLGIGLPFLAAALFAGPFLQMMGRAKRHMQTIEKVMGGLLVVTGLLFMTGQISSMSYWLLKVFPSLGTIG